MIVVRNCEPMEMTAALKTHFFAETVGQLSHVQTAID